MGMNRKGNRLVSSPNDYRFITLACIDCKQSTNIREQNVNRFIFVLPKHYYLYLIAMSKPYYNISARSHGQILMLGELSRHLFVSFDFKTNFVRHFFFFIEIWLNLPGKLLQCFLYYTYLT